MTEDEIRERIKKLERKMEGYLEIGNTKRAKEILKEITNTFSAAALNGTHDEIDLILKAKFMARYEMPKE